MKKKQENQKESQLNQNPGLKAEATAFQVDFTPEFYQKMKKAHLKRVPRIIRPFIKQYFDWLRKLDAGEVMDWMESNETLKELYQKRAFPERVAIAGARGLLKASPKLKRRAAEAINMQIACYTLRFENPLVWEVIRAYGQQGMKKLRQAIEDFKEIMKLKEETA